MNRFLILIIVTVYNRKQYFKCIVKSAPNLISAKTIITKCYGI